MPIYIVYGLKKRLYMSPIIVALYFSFVFLGMLYTFYKVRISHTSILMVLVFWEGLFDYLGSISGMGVLSFYKVVVVIYPVFLLWKKNVSFIKNKADIMVNIAFLLFSVSYWVTYYFYGGEVFTILSQYLYKFSFLWIAYHYFKDISYNAPRKEYVKKVLLVILSVQIAVAVFKIILMRFEFEGLVGTMSYGGGGPAVVIPIVALIFFWLIRDGRFNKKDWIFVALILIIAIASGKRQPILIYPAVLFVLFVFVSQKIRFSAILKYLLVATAVFYVGVKMTPTLTPEKKVGGEFSLSHVNGYVMNYYFGTTELSEILNNDSTGSGRGYGLILYTNPQMLTLYSDKEILFGKGIYEVAIKKHGRFTSGERADYGIQHEGLLGEAGALLYTLGYMGTISMLILVVTIIFSLRNKKLAWLVFLYYLWDLMFYYNQVFFFNSSALIALVIIFYSNSQEKEKMMHLNQHLQTVNSK